MNSRRLFNILTAFFLLVITEHTLDAEEIDFSDAVLTPFWQVQPMTESMFFIQTADEKLPRSTFLFKPTKILKVVSASQDRVYEEGSDYQLGSDQKSLTLPAGSRIPFKSHEEMYPLMTSDLPKIARQAGDKSTGIFFDNKDGYHKLQVEVTYECAPNQWQGPVPQYVGSDLPRLMKKLSDKQPVKIFLSGDSI